MRGWVYVITNSSMPKLVKLGFSMKDPELRAKELEGSGIPTPYQVVYTALVNSPRDIEQFLHLHFREYHHGKEWFQIELNQLIPELEKVIGDEILFSENNNNPAHKDSNKAPPKMKLRCDICDENYSYGNNHECDKSKWTVIACKGCNAKLRLPPNKDLFAKCPLCKVKFKVST